jgi:5,6-dimethylbenzimidazole synthase
VLGKVSIREVEVYSTCLAVGNLWLAARAEGLGVGWVSIVRNDLLRDIFSIPPQVIPVAYLCIGFVEAFPDQPLLESAEWAARMPPCALIHFDSWGGRTQGAGHTLTELVQDPSIWRGLLDRAVPLGVARQPDRAAPPAATAPDDAARRRGR